MKKSIALLLSFISISVNAQTLVTPTELKNMYAANTVSEASVHDPSIAYNPEDKKYYIVGSHIAAASSSDLVNWNWINTGTDHSTFFNKPYYTAFAECPTHEVKVKLGATVTTETLPSFDAGAFCSIYASDAKSWISGDMWAPDVIYNPNMGKWCLYLSLNGDNWASVIILMTADSPKGPFTYEAPIVFGGFNGQTYNGKKVDYKNTDLELVLGKQSSLPSRYNRTNWGTYFPNCIDPNVFFDSNGELWLVYGSWSGGIFSLKLDKNTGLRDYTVTYSDTYNSSSTYVHDPYFGKKIAGGYYNSGEGPYICKIGNYYYLFMSYGFMVAGYENYGASNQKVTGGYEMRIFRSLNPDGPYVDASGVNAVYTSAMLNYGKKSATNRGMRILGAMSGWGTLKKGVTAQGHNSAIVDPNGNAFVIYHTKFNNKDNKDYGHQVRVRQLFQNQDGWLCASPFRYLGDTETTTLDKRPVTTQSIIESEQIYSKEELVGTYQMILHPYKLDWENWEESTPKSIKLNIDGTVSGDYTGTWEIATPGKSFVNVKLGSTTYNGVMLKTSVDGYTNMPAKCISAVSKSGVPLWMYKYEKKSAIANAYKAYYDIINSGANKSMLTTNMPNGFDDVDIWYECFKAGTTTPEPDVLSPEGIFTPTTDGHNVKFVTHIANTDSTYYMSKITTLTKPTLMRGDCYSNAKAYYKLNTTTCVNELNPTEKITVGRASTSGTIPTMNDDTERGNVLHQYFGAQANSSYTRMNNPLYGKNATEFTVGFWVKRLDSNVWDALFSFFNGTTAAASGGRFYITGNGYIGYNDNNGSWFDINHATNSYSDIPVNSWAFVTITANSKSCKLYVNGTQITNHTWNASSGSSTTFNYSQMLSQINTYKYMYLGMGSFWGSAPAYLSDLVVYDRALEKNDIAWMLYKMQSAEYDPYIVLGDADRDGVITIKDATMIVNYYLGNTASNINLNAADVNGDGKITMADANMVKNMIK